MTGWRQGVVEGSDLRLAGQSQPGPLEHTVREPRCLPRSPSSDHVNVAHMGGKFAARSLGGASGVYGCPSPDDLLSVASGLAYLVEAGAPCEPDRQSTEGQRSQSQHNHRSAVSPGTGEGAHGCFGSSRDADRGIALGCQLGSADWP